LELPGLYTSHHFKTIRLQEFFPKTKKRRPYGFDVSMEKAFERIL
jgi:hypothetical protein